MKIGKNIKRNLVFIFTMAGLRLAVIVGVVALAIIISVLYFSGQSSGRIPTKPAISEDEAIMTAESDLKNRVDGVDVVLFFPRDSPEPQTGNMQLPLFFVDNSGILYRINATNSQIYSSCNISEGGTCLSTDSDLNESTKGKLVYHIDGSYNTTDGRSSPTYYFVDANTGKIIFSYVGDERA
jgi:hypothetical protein